MRVTAQIPAGNLTTAFQPGSSDRYVALSVFVPKTVPIASAAREKHDEYIIDSMRLMIWQSFDPAFELIDFKPRAPALQGLKTIIMLNAQPKKSAQPDVSPQPKISARPKRRPGLPDADRSRLMTILNALEAAVTPDDIVRMTNSLSTDPALHLYFSSTHALDDLSTAVSQPDAAMNNLLRALDYLPPVLFRRHIGAWLPLPGSHPLSANWIRNWGACGLARARSG
jgi:hypothetical protein